MLWYNHPEAVQVVHTNLIREGRQMSHKRNLLRLVSRKSG